MVTAPAFTIDAELPSTLTIAGSDEAKATGKPIEEEAESSKAGSPNVLAASGSKVMV